MSDLRIKVEKISKQYRLGEVGTGTFSHDLNRWWHKVLGKDDPYKLVTETNDRTSITNSDYVWALKNINFEVKHGEVLGIIGKNGAGKSTLLKVLSKVTGPSSGKITINGRIGALLEVGTGMHPELTGKENIFLNGAILGMTKKEIKSKFDEIVEFAGISKYIETPFKRYSSGMRVRLGFAVAAFLEPEILIVDEVLAVGDAEFQKRAIGKMQNISKGEGRTILFVSHNMAAVKSICSRAIVLENGQTVFEGSPDKAVNWYLSDGGESSKHSKVFTNIFKKNYFKLIHIKLFQTNNKSEFLFENEEIILQTEIDILTQSPSNIHLTYHLNNQEGEGLFSLSHADNNIILKQGLNKIECVFPKNFFQSGTFYLSLFVFYEKRTVLLIEKDLISFTVNQSEREIGVYMGREPGFIRPKLDWKIKSSQND
ncbi:MAG: ABC transporter [Crocinitomicaceae bacterium]|nr:ABC transporter [Crocinitomicaceae bacterium]